MKVAVVTASRAEYGLLLPLLHRLKNDPFFTLQLIVTGMHLSHEFGLTYKEIEKDGFTIQKKIEMVLSSDTPTGIAKSMGLATISASECFEELKPDILILLGDRYEILSFASAAVVARIPIAHIHGGELTEGLIDDPFRHAITKMSYLHFCAMETYKKRIIQMGEEPNRVHVVGALGLDTIYSMDFLNQNELEEKLGIRFKSQNAIVTFHPVTLEDQSAEKQFSELLKAIETLDDTFIVFTKPNSDTDGRIIIDMIDRFVGRFPERSAGFTSLGQKNYLSLMNFVDLVIGNSSSGLLEAPYFRKPTINIGDRQTGRFKPESVIDCLPECESILSAIKKSKSPEFKAVLKSFKNPLGDGKATDRIISHLKVTSLQTKKKFFDLT
ncbi:UDP-N-acetyl-D-glucosamine 2-epimerase, UDP-hydrolysing [Leptospira ryugenii]|uniref:UDP-N-acetyl-D-glucosamine 2-epimerase, UDP-hydrolysing n=1 Tax=Leptospira ryugenii TaxID=1917863 RepID=A0A2P2DW03_9LEPT|nr:UDP-N-acetylglucosamine 2-epimerase [Leptospira ryugenii]GBF48812.1 UDP-N-acetyl-D-glucosamine 2-epimerase, UDP-hydrolysing [Leptospira ryugenii]